MSRASVVRMLASSNDGEAGANGGVEAPPVAFAYDRYGNVLTDAAAGTAAGVVTYGYDLADRTTSITRASTTTSLGLDALGRVRTRTALSSTDTLSYEGAGNAVVRVANAGGGGSVTDGLVDAAGTRLGTRVGSGGVGAWLVPDLHGSIAAGLAPAASAVSDALRYDGYGVTLAVHAGAGSGATAHWRYQGRLDLVPGPADPAVPSLYDFGFREYAPSLGAFTSLDDLVGTAQEPLSLNRFLYAHANPATLVDPDGHCAVVAAALGPAGWIVAGLTCAQVAAGAAVAASATLMAMQPQEVGDAVVGLGGELLGGLGHAARSAADSLDAYEVRGRVIVRKGADPRSPDVATIPGASHEAAPAARTPGTSRTVLPLLEYRGEPVPKLRWVPTPERPDVISDRRPFLDNMARPPSDDNPTPSRPLNCSGSRAKMCTAVVAALAVARIAQDLPKAGPKPKPQPKPAPKPKPRPAQYGHVAL